MVQKKDGQKNNLLNPPNLHTGSLSDLYCPDISKVVKRALSQLNSRDTSPTHQQQSYMKSNTNLSKGLNTVATSQKRLPSYRQHLTKKKKMMGVLGINSIEDDSYQDYLLMYKASEDPLDVAGAGGATKKISL